MRAFIGCFLLVVGSLFAEPSLKLEVPRKEAWTGERIPFYIELRAPGSYEGAPNFDLPQIERSVVLKVGSPILGTMTENGQEFLTQRHEFALFSQASGEIELPPIKVRFSHLKGYTGPAFDAELVTPATRLKVNRPEGSEALGFLVTTESLEIEEKWDQQPGDLKTGDVLKRTIVQKASNLAGMALAPAPTDPIDGIRVYPGDPEVMDDFQRGAFSGMRTETITYLVQEPGIHQLPEIRLNWFNPKTGKLESKLLPGAEINASAPPVPPVPKSPWRFLWLLLPLAALALCWIYRGNILHGIQVIRDRVDPPNRRTTRALLKACRANDAQAAAKLWGLWCRQNSASNLNDELRSEALQMHRSLYGPDNAAATWSGAKLAESLRHQSANHQTREKASSLPELNP